MKNLLADPALVPYWVEVSFPIIRIALFFIMLIASVTIVVTVLMQSNSSSGGTNVISGVQESYYASNKGATKEGRLKKLTIIMASIVAVCIILYFVSLIVYSTAA